MLVIDCMTGRTISIPYPFCNIHGRNHTFYSNQNTCFPCLFCGLQISLNIFLTSSAFTVGWLDLQCTSHLKIKRKRERKEKSIKYLFGSSEIKHWQVYLALICLPALETSHWYCCLINTLPIKSQQVANICGILRSIDYCQPCEYATHTHTQAVVNMRSQQRHVLSFTAFFYPCMKAGKKLKYGYVVEIRPIKIAIHFHEFSICSCL